MVFEIYTDGSCRDNGTDKAIGAWGYIVYYNGEIVTTEFGDEVGTTNQRMELMAAIKACEYIVDKLVSPFDQVKVFTDSAYLYNCFRSQWYEGWIANDWINSKKEPVKNRDLWERLIRFFNYPEFDFYKVKGHSTNQNNNIIDNLVQARTSRLKEKLNG